jgi:hypothetical protein
VFQRLIRNDLPPRAARFSIRGMPETRTRQKISFAEMRASGVRGVLVYCSDYPGPYFLAGTIPGFVLMVVDAPAQRIVRYGLG